MPERGAPTAVLAEDEVVLRAELRALLAGSWPQLRVVGEAGNGVEALDLAEHHRPDVLFLDIEMSPVSGLAVARRLQGSCHIVFVTAYDAHAIAAFDTGAVDYVLKPLQKERLALTVERLRQRLGTPPPDLESLLRQLAHAPAARNHLHWINASVGDTVRIITVDEVLYFTSDNKYTRVVTAASEALIRKSLQELAGELDPEVFWPIHRSTIVNANAIASVSRDFRGRLSLRLKQRPETLVVSESHQGRFRSM